MTDKQIILPTFDHIKKANIEKPKKIRVSIENLTNVLQDEDYTIEKQLEVLHKTINEPGCDSSDKKCKTMLQHINLKLQSYKTQDVKNDIYDESCFVDIPFVLEKIKSSNLQCYYCSNQVLLFYKHVREPTQWTLERINNDIGHTKQNIEIACLSCNLHRRCMHHERFMFTKRMKICKMEEV